MSLVWWDGGLVPEADARLSARALGVQYGYGLYETLRSYDGVLFRVGDHVERIVCAGERIGLHTPARESIESAVHAVLNAHRATDAVLRISLFAVAASGAPAPAASDGAASALLVTAGPVPDWSDARDRGVRVIVSAARRDVTSPLAGLKTTSSLSALLARREAALQGADDALFLTHDGRVSEFTAANVFFVRDGVLLTPSLACGCLPGVTRAVVLSLAPRLGLSASDGAFTLADLHSAEECFMSGSVREIVPVVAVGETRIGRGVPGPVTRDVYDAYVECVREDVAHRLSGRSQPSG